MVPAFALSRLPDESEFLVSGKKQTRNPETDICAKGMIGNKMTEMKNQRAGNDGCMTPAAALKLQLLYSRLLFQVVIG